MSWLRERVHRLIESTAAAAEPAHPELVITNEDVRYLTAVFDDTTPLPLSAAALTATNPELRDLRARYERFEAPVVVPSRWNKHAVNGFLDLRYFRGDTMIMWHYRELLRPTLLKYLLYAQYVRDRDSQGLLSRLSEDGAFGCWTFRYEGHPLYSRDLLESVNEIGFLERRLGLSRRSTFSVLDIGAGYGRMAHRMTCAYPNLADYFCVDAVAEATFLCDYYLRERGCTPPARSVPLDELDRLVPGGVDVAVNIHSFPECTFAAIEWWIGLVRRLEIPTFLIIPNEPSDLLSLEPDGRRRDFRPLLEAAGYRLEHSEPVISDPAIRESVRLRDHFFLFTRE